MKHYYISLNGHYEVHEITCLYIPSTLDRMYLGFFSTIEEAILEAKKNHVKSGGCAVCCVPHYIT